MAAISALQVLLAKKITIYELKFNQRRLSAGQVLGDAKNPVDGGKDEDDCRNSPLANDNCSPAITNIDLN